MREDNFSIAQELFFITELGVNNVFLLQHNFLNQQGAPRGKVSS